MMCLADQLCPTLQLYGLRVSLPVSSVRGDSPRQEYWSRLRCPPGDLPNPGNKPGSPTLQADSLPAELPGKPHHT